MSETPDKMNIEKLLKAYARRRRDAAGTPGIHPATRRMLQAEVRRQHPAGRESSAPRASNWLGLLWPRVTATCGVLAILAFLGILLIPRGEKSGISGDLAKAESMRRPDARVSRESVAPMAMATASSSDGKLTQPPASLKSESRSIATATHKDQDNKQRTSGPASGSGPIPAPVSGSSIVDRQSDIGGVLLAGTHNKPTTESSQDKAPGYLAGADQPALDNLKVWEDGGRKLKSADDNAPRDESGTMNKAMNFSRMTTNAIGEPAAAGGTADFDRDRSDTFADAVGVARVGGTMSRSVTDIKEAQAAKGSVLHSPGSSGSASSSQDLSQRYRNFGASGPKPDAAAVLEEFTVRQSGERLTVVDRDGSVYAGYIAATNQAISSQNLTATGDQPLYFRVEGTNRSLQQRVVFTGNMIPGDGGGGGQNKGNAQMPGQRAAQWNSQNTQQALPAIQGGNFLINGRVQLGNSPATSELNARPADR